MLREGAFIIVNGSGNGGGKTYLLVAIAASLMWPKIAPQCLQHPIIQQWKYPRRIRIVSTPKELEEIGSLQAAIKELFPRGRYTERNKGKSYPSEFKADTGWIMDMMSYEQDASEMAGPTIGCMMWNEPMPESLWKEGLSRLRKGGLSLVAMTSLLDNPWVVDGIIGKADGDKIRLVYADVEENCKQHGTNGALEHEQIEKILSQYDPDEREARKTGKPLSFSGRIFKSFDRRLHVARNSSNELRKSAGSEVTFYQVIDPAIGKPFAILWAYVDKSGIVTIFDEFPNFPFEGAKDSNLSISDYVGVFKHKEQGFKVENRIIDRHFANRRQEAGGATLKQDFADKGLHFFDSYSVAADQPEVETGILRIKEYLRFDLTKNISSINRPKLVIGDNCKNLISAMERWARNIESGKPREEYKDHVDCLRYLLMSNPQYEAPRNWEEAKMPYYGVGQIIS